jgi:PAS domain S-box-containing protein
MPLPLSSLLSELAELLAVDDARDGLTRALKRLSELGIREAMPGAPLCLRVEARDRSLQLTGGEPEVCAALAPLLKLALRRAADQERLKLLSEASFEGILVHVDGVAIDVNQRLADMLGCAPDELLGPEAMHRTIAPEDLPSTMERIATGFEGTYTVTAIRRDGSRFRAELQSKQGWLGDRSVRIAAVRDVTEQDHTLKLLRDSEKHL